MIMSRVALILIGGKLLGLNFKVIWQFMKEMLFRGYPMGRGKLCLVIVRIFRGDSSVGCPKVGSLCFRVRLPTTMGKSINFRLMAKECSSIHQLGTNMRESGIKICNMVPEFKNMATASNIMEN